MIKNYYNILDISDNATQEEIKAAYRKLAKKYHPDKNPDNTYAKKKFREINEAYEILKDVEKKEEHDNQFTKFKSYKKGNNLKISINVTRLELIQCARRMIVVKRKGLCKTCKGTGSTTKSLKKCVHCDGTGLHGFSLVLGEKKKCEYCFGIGSVPEGEKCPICKGTALIDEIKHHYITLNPSVEIIKIPRLGNYQLNSSPGDLLVNLNIIEDPNYQVVNLNVIGRIEISPAQAVLGDILNLKVFKEKVKLRIPPGTQNGQEIEFKGKGISYKKDVGDFKAIIHIKIPVIITKPEKTLYKKLFKHEKEASCQVKVMSF
jgi:molecular chaperone DnaJ